MPEETAPETGTDPDASTPSEPAPEPTAPAAAPGPWANDLATSFEDEAVRAQVDSFLRETVQPRVTELEQATKENRNATKLWTDFTDKPVETFVTVADELFGADVTQAIARLVSGEAPEPEDEDLLAGLDDEEAAKLPPEQQEVIDWASAKRREEAYEAEFERVKADNEDLEIDEGLFHPFVVAAEGDFDVAAQGYKEFVEQAKGKFGIQVPNPDEVDVPPAPNVLAGDTATPSTPPTETKYESLDEALDAFFDEQKPPPPVVGAS